MRQIYKWILDLSDEQEIEAPLGGIEFLSVQEQYGKLCLWGVVEDNSYTGRYTVRVFGTGRPLPNYLDTNTYIGTAVMSDGYVWHVFRT